MMEAKKTILLAEDDENDIFLMRRSVRKMKEPVILQFVKNGEEAIAYLSAQGKFADRLAYPLPGLILLDINMPRKNGFDVLSWLRADSALSHIPVLIVSSSRVQTDLDRARQLGAVAYLLKPVSFDQLQQLFTSTEKFLAAHLASPFPSH